jgi:hypothetical protein
MRRLAAGQKLILVALLVMLVFPLGAQPARAGCSFLVYDCIGELIDVVLGLPLNIANEILNTVADIIKGIIKFTAGIFFYFAKLLIQAALNANNDLIINSTLHLGYNITLSIANMGFVLALVVIAFATMFRATGFAYQRALPRLIIAALLINFGFFIVTNIFILPTDQVTKVFIKQSGFSVSNSFKVFGEIASDTDKWGKDLGGAVSGIAQAIGSVIFTAFFSFFGILAFLAFAGMLFVRYVAMFLLITLLPLAWVTWIFPGLRIPGGHPWSVWWESFMRWLLFAPVAAFFFYLATRVANDIVTPNTTTEELIEYFGKVVATVGLLLGGLYAANQMGVRGGAFVLEAAQKSRAWAEARAKFVAYRGISAPLRSERAREFIEKAQTSRSGIVRFTGRQLNIASARSEARLQAEYQRRMQALAANPLRLARAIPTFKGPALVEALNILREKNALPLIPQKIGDEPWGIQRYIKDEETEKLFTRFGRQFHYQNIERAVGFNREMLSAAEMIQEAEKKGDETKKLEGQMNLMTATEKFVKDRYLSPSDWAMLGPRLWRPGDQLGLVDASRQAIMTELEEAILKTNPEVAIQLRPKMNADELNNLREVLLQYIDKLEKTEWFQAEPDLRGIGVPTKEKLKYIDENLSQWSVAARRLYNARDRVLTGLMFMPFQAPPSAPPPAAGQRP